MEPEPGRDHARNPVVPVEHEVPDEPGRDIREHVRQEEDHPEPDRANDPAGDHQRDRERERQLDEKGEDDDEAVVDQRPDEGRVVEQVAVVLEPDEFFRRPVAVPVEEAVPARLDDRQGDEDGEQKKRRRQKDDDDRPAVDSHPPGGLDIGRRGRLGFGVGHYGQETAPRVASRASASRLNGEAESLRFDLLLVGRHPGSRRPRLPASSGPPPPKRRRH